MQREQYTADAICWAMGLGGFVEPDWSPPVLRLLLKPSFDPEVCITLYGPAERARLSVTALAESLWQRSSPCGLTDPFVALHRAVYPELNPSWSEQAEVDPSAFPRCLAEFAEACAADIDGVCLDGMSVECCLATEDGLARFARDSYCPEVSALVARLLRLAWQLCSEAGVRNGLAACARYIGEEFPCQPPPPVPAVTRLLILGTPEARADFFKCKIR